MAALDPSKAYAAIDLLDCFLSCLAGAPEDSPGRGPQRAPALAALDMLPAKRERPGPILGAPACDSGGPSRCIRALGPIDTAPFETEDARRLWTTLERALAALGPMAAARRQAPMPRSLDQAWSLLEAASLYECSSEGAGSDGSSGRL